MRTLMQFLLGVGLGLWFREILNRPSSESGRRQSLSEMDGAEDELRTITGIGPVFESALHAVGIHTIAQLAEQDADALGAQLGAPATPERIRRERWIEQAKERSGT